MTELDQLLMRLRDGESDPEVLARAKALLRDDERLPLDLREVGLDDDDPAIAAGALLGVLGLDDGLLGGLLGEALFAEAGAPWEPPEAVAAPDAPGEVEVTAAMLEAQEAAGLPPVAAAVRWLAGEVEVAVPVLRALGVDVIEVGPAVTREAGDLEIAAVVSTRLGDLPAPVIGAVAAEAGEVEVARPLAGHLGEPLWPIAAAVRVEAGEVEVAVPVLTALGATVLPLPAAIRAEAGDIEIAEAVAPSSVDVAVAVRAEAGTVDVTEGVAPRGMPVAAAVGAEAGEVDLSRAVLDVAGAVTSEAGTVDVRDAVLARITAAQAEETPTEVVDLDPADVPLHAPLAEAVRALAGEVDLVADVAVRLGLDALPDLASAVAAEAGTVDIVGALAPALDDAWISALVDHELPAAAHRLAARRLMRDPGAAGRATALADLGQHLRGAVADGAGETPYLWAAVAPRIGLADPEAVPGYDGALVAEAVRAEAGPVHIVQGVMDCITAEPEVMPDLEAPAAANTNRWWQTAGLVVAATLLVTVLVGRMLPVTLPPGSATVASEPDFATADEVSVEELSYDEDVEVFVTLPDEEGDRPLIIWVQEEV